MMFLKWGQLKFAFSINARHDANFIADGLIARIDFGFGYFFKL
jgi:hypothetical protein